MNVFPCELRKHTYPFTIRVIHSKAELIRTIDQYMLNGEYSTGNDSYPIGQWDVSRIEDFSYVLDAEHNPLLVHFNEDLSDWDTSHAKNLKYMFHGCHCLNSDVSRWDVSNATNMSYMFAIVFRFNMDLSHWAMPKQLL
jgi:surface protein